MELDFTSPAFWLAVGQIVLIDILLGGDNAVVITPPSGVRASSGGRSAPLRCASC